MGVPDDKNLVGYTFGYLTLIKDLGRFRDNGGTSRRKFLCECDCGTKKELGLKELKSGNTSLRGLKAK